MFTSKLVKIIGKLKNNTVGNINLIITWFFFIIDEAFLTDISDWLLAQNKLQEGTV